MAGNSFGELFRITTWGESHGRAIGVVIDGCPAGLDLSPEDIQHDLDRRRVGQSKVTSPRQEEDRIEILSGLFQGKTTGTPISLLIWNKDADSSKYEPIKDIYRPGHADFTYDVKYGFRDYRGGGRSSARETACRVAAAAVAKKLLSTIGIRIYGFTRQVGAIEAQVIDVDEIERNLVRSPDKEAAKQMEALILEAKAEGDSVGGVVEVVATGMPVGLGEPVYDRLDADLAKAIMSINAIKGMEIGLGFRSVSLRGSEHNDEFYTDDSGKDSHANKPCRWHVGWHLQRRRHHRPVGGEAPIVDQQVPTLRDQRWRSGRPRSTRAPRPMSLPPRGTGRGSHGRAGARRSLATQSGDAAPLASAPES